MLILDLVRLFISRNAKRTVAGKKKKRHSVIYIYLHLTESFDPGITSPRADVDPIMAITERLGLILCSQFSLNLVRFHVRGRNFHPNIRLTFSTDQFSI